VAQEAELNIKARLTGNLKQGLAQTRKALHDFAAEQHRALTDTARMGAQADRAWSQAGSGITTATSAMSRAGGELLNIQNLVLGIGAGLAGGTVMEKLIGSNAQLESAKTTFNVLVGDVRQADKLIGDVRKYAANTPFGESEALDGSKRLLRLTGQNAEQNIKLLKLAGQLKAISPDKTFADAVEAILDAEGMEFERLKEFGIKLKGDDVKKAKKKGETLGQASLRGFEEALNKQTGGRDVVAALAGTFEGRTSTIKDRFAESFRKIGEPAFNVLGAGLTEFEKSLNEIETSPAFKKDFEDVAEALASGARSGVELVKQLPQAVAFARALKDEVVGFAQGNAGLLKLVGGGVVASKLTGVGAGQALGAGKRLLFGGGGAAPAAGPLGLAGGEPIPVFVTNMGAGGLGGEAAAAAAKASKGSEFITRNTGGKGFGSTAKAFGAAVSSEGVLATLGAGGSAAGGGLLALFAASALTLADVTARTQRVVKGFEEAEEAERKKRITQIKTVREQDEARNKDMAARRALTGGTRDYFSKALSPGVPAEEREKLLAQGLVAAQNALGGGKAKVKGKKGSKEQQLVLDALEREVGALGITFSFGKGSGGTVASRLKVDSGVGALDDKTMAEVAQFRKINDLKLKNPEVYQQLSSRPEFQQLNKRADVINERVKRGQALGPELGRAARAVNIGRIEVNLNTTGDATGAQVAADQLLIEINKALALADQQ